jgi:acyl carrier protein
MSDEFIQRIRTVVANSQRIPVEKVTIESTFQELGIDSMDAVNILFGLESEFDINIPDDEVKDIRTVRQMAEGVEKLVAAKAAGPASTAGPAPAQ